LRDAPKVHWLVYQQLLDSALPIGGFSHSFGLETMVQQARLQTIDELEAYIRSMLFHSWTSSDAMAIKAVYLYAPSQQWQQIWFAERVLHVQRASSEARSGVLKMGRRLLQLVRSLYPDLGWSPLDEAIREERCFGTHPLIHGWFSCQMQIPLEKAVEGYLYCCMVTCINSALRLMSIGQTQGQVLLAKLLPLTESAWREVEHLDPLDAFTNMPAAEMAMMQHETLYSRLFMS
jgi:urease accessory protein